MRNSDKKVIKTTVKSSIKKLLSEAKKAARAGKNDRSRKYVKMAMALVKKHKVRLDNEQKTSFCRKCFVWWVPKKTLKLVFDKRHNTIRVKCSCGYSRRL